jgi:Protein of unknown function (DUF1194)
VRTEQRHDEQEFKDDLGKSESHSGILRSPGTAKTMTKIFRYLILALTILTGWTGRVEAREPVDLLLVLAADVSGSIDQSKFQLQREGYAAAISNPRVLDGIRSGPNGRIAVSFVEWSGPVSQKNVIDWTLIGDSIAARRFGDQLLKAPRSLAGNTSISAAVDFAMTLFNHAPYESKRRVVDISGDGTNNAGRDIALARNEALAGGVTINGLVILTEKAAASSSEHTNPPGGLVNYYRNNVIGGPGAFVIVAENFNSFGQAIIMKLIAEIAQRQGTECLPAPAAWWLN